jgi:hypothetical protein
MEEKFSKFTDYQSTLIFLINSDLILIKKINRPTLIKKKNKDMSKKIKQRAAQNDPSCYHLHSRSDGG